MTMTAEPQSLPNGAAPPDSGPRSTQTGSPKPTLRFAAKIARRELRQRRGRAILVIALIAVPTWIMLNVATYVRTANLVETTPAPDFSSDLVIPFADRPTDETSAFADRGFAYFPPATETSADLAAALPSGSTTQRVIGGYTSIMTGDGEIESAHFTKMDLTTDAASSWAPLSEGHAPRAGEAVLGADLAASLDVGVGDTVTLREPEGSWRVVGLTEWNEPNLFVVSDFDESLLSAPSGLLLVDLPRSIDDADEAGRLADELGGWRTTSGRFGPENPSYIDASNSIALTWLAGMMIFIMFGIVIVAAFATIARGQLVTVGQLAANGAKERFTRRVLAMQGFWAGLAGVTVGTIAAALTLPLLKPFIVRSFWSPPQRVECSVIDVAIIALIGGLVATAAAALPSLSLVKTSVLDALAGRRAERPVPTWMVPVGVAAFGLGLLLLVTSAASSTNAGIAGAMIGALAMAIGVCLIGPLAIDIASRAAPVMPLSVRISLRGLGRARLRSAAVVASIAVTTGVMATIIAGLQTDAHGPRAGEMADNVAFVEAFPSVTMRTPDGNPLLDDNGVPLADLPASIDTVELTWVAADSSSREDEVRSVLPDATTHPLRTAVRPDGLYDNANGAFVHQPHPDERANWIHAYGTLPPGIGSGEFDLLPLVADEATLAAFSLPDSFARDLDNVGYAMVQSARDCNGESFYWGTDPIDAPPGEASGFDPAEPVTIPVKGLACWMSVGPFMTEQFAADHGYQIEPAGTVFTNPDALTAEQRDQLTNDFTYPSVFAEWDYAGTDTYTSKPAAASSVATNSQLTIRSGVSFYYPPINAGDFALVQLVMVAIAVVVVTLIAGVGLALAASDSRRDRAVLSVVGAKPATQRRVAASDALVLVMIGTLLGVPAALFAAWVVTTASYQDTPTGVPWPFVAAEFIVVPLIVTAIAYVSGLLRPTTPPMRVLHSD